MTNQRGSAMLMLVALMGLILILAALVATLGMGLLPRIRLQSSADLVAISGAASQASSLNRIRRANTGIHRKWLSLQAHCRRHVFRDQRSALRFIEFRQEAMDRRIEEIRELARTGALDAEEMMRTVASRNQPGALLLDRTPRDLRESLFDPQAVEEVRSEEDLVYRYCADAECRWIQVETILVRTSLEEKPGPLTHVVVELRLDPPVSHRLVGLRRMRKQRLPEVLAYAAARPYDGYLAPGALGRDYKAWVMPVQEARPEPRIPRMRRIEH